jgi:hypothetical protein
MLSENDLVVGFSLPTNGGSSITMQQLSLFTKDVN